LTVGPTDATGTHTILVVNRGEATIHVNVLKQSFTGARDGSMSFSSRAPYSAANWVHVAPASFELAPGRSQNVVVSIVVPPNPDLGDHQLAIVFLVPAGTSTSNIRINRGVATPVYITVPGITNDTAQVSNLAAPAFSAGGPVRVTAQIHDSGTVHRDFRGTTALAIRGTASTTFPDFTVVRGSTREISSLWNPPVFCVCQLSVAITNANGVSTSKTVQVIVFPVLAASIILGVLIALAFLILFNKRRLRRREARIAAGRHSFGSRGDD
jgi:hypothetical protein